MLLPSKLALQKWGTTLVPVGRKFQLKEGKYRARVRMVYLSMVWYCTLYMELLALTSNIARAKLVLPMNSQITPSWFDVMHDDGRVTHGHVACDRTTRPKQEQCHLAGQNNSAIMCLRQFGLACKAPGRTTWHGLQNSEPDNLFSGSQQ